MRISNCYRTTKEGAHVYPLSDLKDEAVVSDKKIARYCHCPPESISITRSNFYSADSIAKCQICNIKVSISSFDYNNAASRAEKKLRSTPMYDKTKERI